MTAPTPPPQPFVFQTLDRCAPFPYARSEYLRRLAWLAAQATVVRASPARGYAWRRWWLSRFGAHAQGSTRPSAHVLHPWLLCLGPHSMLGDRVRIYNLGPVTIGSHTVLSQDVYVCAGTHDYTRPDLPLLRPTVTIGSGVWVCAGAFIGPGVHLGDNCVIGARAVVVGDIPAGAVAAGNPARVIKQRRMDGAATPATPPPAAAATATQSAPSAAHP